MLKVDGVVQMRDPDQIVDIKGLARWAADAKAAAGQCGNVNDRHGVNWVEFLRRFGGRAAEAKA